MKDHKDYIEHSFRRPGAARVFSTPGGVYNATPARIVFGAGTHRTVRAEVERLGAKRALVISTPGRNGLAADIAALLGDRCAGILPEAISQVPIELAIEGRGKVAAAGADCLVSVGGGAAVGLGKGVSLELGLPIIAIPTTYSGSEMTGFCGITIDGVKRMHTSLNMLAATVIYDPELSVSLPLDISLASAMNALAHCVDAIYIPTVSPQIAANAVEGAAVLARAMRDVARDPGSIDARADLLYGAHLGGAALTGGFALQHGVAHTLGGSFDVPHGLSHALVLPYVAAYNERFADAELGLIREALGCEGGLGAAIHDLMTDVGLPHGLRGVGISEGDIAGIARITVETDNALNPGPVTMEAVTGIAEAALSGLRP